LVFSWGLVFTVFCVALPFTYSYEHAAQILHCDIEDRLQRISEANDIVPFDADLVSHP